jgi:hypothetical protein
MGRILLLFISINLFPIFSDAQKMTSNDSMIYRNYWNKIGIKATGSKGDYLYNGIDNHLQVRCPDSISSKLRLFLGVNNGKIFKTEDGYLTIPKNVGRSFVTTYYSNENNDTLVIGKKQFIVLAISSPTLQIGQTIIKEKSTVDKNVFFTADSLKLFFTDDYPESEHWFNIEYFMIGYSYGGVYISVDNEGAKLSPKTLEFIKKLNPGQDVVIKVNSITPSTMLISLPLMRFKIL